MLWFPSLLLNLFNIFIPNIIYNLFLFRNKNATSRTEEKTNGHIPQTLTIQPPNHDERLLLSLNVIKTSVDLANQQQRELTHYQTKMYYLFFFFLSYLLLSFINIYVFNLLI